VSGHAASRLAGRRAPNLVCPRLAVTQEFETIHPISVRELVRALKRRVSRWAAGFLSRGSTDGLIKKPASVQPTRRKRTELVFCLGTTGPFAREALRALKQPLSSPTQSCSSTAMAITCKRAWAMPIRSGSPSSLRSVANWKSTLPSTAPGPRGWSISFSISLATLSAAKRPTTSRGARRAYPIDNHRVTMRSWLLSVGQIFRKTTYVGFWPIVLKKSAVARGEIR
jgi:hypothetical protein